MRCWQTCVFLLFFLYSNEEHPMLMSYNALALSHLEDQWDYVEHLNFAWFNRRVWPGKGRSPTQGMTTLQRIKYKIMERLKWSDASLFRSACFGVGKKSESVTQFRARVSKALNRLIEKVEAKHQADDKTRDPDYKDVERKRVLFETFTAMQKCVLDALRPLLAEVCLASKNEVLWELVQTERVSREKLTKYEKVLADLKKETEVFMTQSNGLRLKMQRIQDIEARL